MQFTPRTPQKLAIDFLIRHDRANLFASMGIGKTVSAATAIDFRQSVLGDDRPALIMAPLRVAKLAWPADIKKWNHLKHIETVQIVGTKKEREAALKELGRGNAQIAITNYEQLPNLVSEFQKSRKWPFGIHVADESTRIRNFRLRGQGTQRAGAIGKIAHLSHVKWWNMSGTPVPKGYGDLWGQLWFIDQGARLGRTYTAFKDRWFRGIPDSEFHETELMPHSAPEIERLIADVSLVLKAEDFFDLPSVIHNRITVELPKEAKDIYRTMEKKFFVELDGEGIEAGTVSARSMKLRQIASGSIYHDPGWTWLHDAKIDALRSVMNEAMGMPVLVAYQFKADLERLLRAFPQGRVLDKKQQTLDDWNAGKIPILFAHPASCGHGLSLQEGSNILCFFSLDFNLEYFQQMIERIGPTRQMQSGFNRPVIIHYLLADKTIDKYVLDVIIGKATLQEAFKNALIEYRNQHVI